MNELLDFIDCGGQAAEIEADAAQESRSFCLSRGFQRVGLEACQDPEVDAVPWPCAVSDSGIRLGPRSDQRPVGGVLGPLLDPELQDIDLGRRKPVASFPGRHAERLVFLGDPQDQGTGFGIARDDRRLAALERLDRRCALVQPQTFGPFRFVLTVACETVLGQDRPNFTIEIDRPGFWRALLCRHRRCAAVQAHH